MDSAGIQAKIWRGYGKSAAKLGSEYQFYRPAAGVTASVWTDPTTHALNNLLLARNVALNAEDMKFSRPNKYGKATSYALVDGSDLAAGDYFVGQQGTFFIAAMQLLLPILAVECNRTVSIERVPPSSVGAAGYSGMQNATAYVSGVPCSILQGTKGEKSEVNLPGDTRMPWWTILMPGGVGNVLFGDLILDDLGRRYLVSSAELTDLGYRLTATLAMT